MIRYAAKVPEAVTRRVGTQAKKILQRGIGTPAEKISTGSSRLLTDVIDEAAGQERRAAELLELRAKGYKIPAGTRHLSGGSRGWEDIEKVSNLSPPAEGHKRLWRGSGPEGRDHWFDPVNLGTERETHLKRRGAWFTDEPEYATSYANTSMSHQLTKRHSGLGISSTLEERRFAQQMDPWGSVRYVDLTPAEWDITKQSGIMGREFGLESDQVLRAKPVFNIPEQLPAKDETAARVMENIAASKRARAARFEATARPHYRDPAIAEKRAARLTMKSSPSSGRMGGVPTRSKTTSQVSKQW